MNNLIEQKEYFYHCKIYKEHLVTGAQVEIMNATSEKEVEWIKKSGGDPDCTEPEGWNDLRWHNKESVSFAEKDFDEFIERIRQNILLETKGKHITQRDNNKVYILYENYHYWIKELILTRLNIYIYRHAVIEQKSGFIENLVKELV